jgi:putative heme transporter
MAGGFYFGTSLTSHIVCGGREHVSANEPTTSEGAPPRRRTRARRIRRLLVVGAGAALAYFGVSLLVNNFDEVTGAADIVGHPHFGWLALAVAAEILSYVAYAAAQRRLLVAEGIRAGLPRLTLLAVAAQALGVCIPGGYAWSNVLSYRVMRRWHIEEITSGRVLLVTAAIYVAALGVLAAIGAQIAGGSGPVGDVRIVAYTLLAVIAVIVGVLLLKPQAARRAVVAGAAALERVFRGRRAAATRATRLRDELERATAFGRGALGASSVWLMAAWLTDVACLAAAFGAVGAAPPWRGLLLAYCGGQLAALLPFTPGGLGVVEGSLTFALVSYGGGQERTVAAVLLYRLISFWGLIPSGAACYAALKTRWMRGDPEPAAEVAA